ncbi:MAG: hypothetical protein IID53_09580 [Proteobacteria bacterium]|nr:hypothetical protein [Pseudomonadota bacterium]
MKSRIIIPALLACFSLALSGCALFEDAIQEFAVDPVVKVEPGEDGKIAVIDLATYPPWEKPAYYTDPRASKETRNKLQEAIIARSVVACSDFRKRLYALHGTRKILFQGASLLLSGTAAVVGGGAAQALAAASAGALGIDETIDANALQNAAITAVLNTIATGRAQALTAMRKKQNRTIKKYSMQAAVGDAIRYNKLCSLTEAISAMSNALQKKNSNASVIKRIKTTNAKILLGKAEDELIQLSTASLKSPVAITAAEARVERLKNELKVLLNATTEEVVEGIATPVENR